jgi:hypothetical protein
MLTVQMLVGTLTMATEIPQNTSLFLETTATVKP